MSSEQRWTDYSATASNMRQCGNCGAHVDPSFVRVLEPDECQQARCCPECPDLIRRYDGVEERHEHDRHRGGL